MVRMVLKVVMLVMFNEAFCHKILQFIYEERPSKEEFEEFIRVFDGFKDEYLSQCEIIDDFNRNREKMLIWSRGMLE